MIVAQEGTITTSGTGAQYNSTSYTVPAGRTLYLSRFVIWIATAPTALFALGLSSNGTNAGLIGLQYDSSKGSYESELTKPYVLFGGQNIAVFSSGWPTSSSIGWLFQGDLV